MPGPTDLPDDDVVTRRTLDTTRDAPAIGLVEIVADLEETDAMELTPIYDRADDLIDDLFGTPPGADADARLEFTYQGYRIAVEQDGTVVIREPSA
ncbi:HalOD1 output domain-containing protein [Haloterrigena salinisoli]|uniref:HalOD1 output domain-containing protein n=1 Tax=Haloterrigena salinisoli TaxID=3132747 RepID=UPI0030CECCEE